MSGSRSLAASLALAAVLAAAPARAQQAATAQAQAIFNVGAQAYAKGDFEAALQAFEEAYRAAPRPGILFSMAQAHRKQFYVDRGARHLDEAIRGYKGYLDKQPDGARRAEAAQALLELEPLAERMTARDLPAAAAAPEVPKPKTRLMVSSAAPGARVRLDGGPERASPLIEEVAAGDHTIEVTAPGFFDYGRKVTAVDGGLVALDVPMREQPARITVRGDAGAEVALDQRPIGILPLPGPVEMPPGRHFLAVTRTGARPFTQELSVGRAERRTVDVVLSSTGQRVAAQVLAASAVGGVIAGAVFAGLAVGKDARASSLLDASATRNLTPSELDEYTAARASREDWKAASAVALGGSLALGLVSGGLWLFDAPRVQAPSTTESLPTGPATPDTMEVSVLPRLGPEGGGAAVVLRF